MKTSSIIVATILGAMAISPVGALAASSAPTAGKFAFPTDANPDKASCTQLTQETASRLASPPYRCESTPLSSGKTALVCSRSANGRGSFMVFDTKKACDSERKDQANAE